MELEIIILSYHKNIIHDLNGYRVQVECEGCCNAGVENKSVVVGPTPKQTSLKIKSRSAQPEIVLCLFKSISLVI